jgi:hypothetical protein
MSTKILPTTLAAIACAAVVSAQAPPPVQTPAPPSARPAAQRPPDRKATNDLTVMGCVERSAAAIAPGAADNPAAPGASESSRFILTKVMKPTGTAGSAGSSPATYQLDADDSKLTGHVGQKVEIKGTLAERSSIPSAAKGGSSSDAPRLKVESVKMIAATCTE